jgi:AraC-like DNA-binding protein
VVERREDRHQIEFVAAMLVRACRQITGQRLMPSRVRFMHLRTRPCAEFRAIFGDDLRFGATADEVIFDRNVKDIPLVAADPYLNKMLVHYCEEALIHRSSARSSFRSRVENAIVPLLPHRKASVEEIALRLAMSNRSLARHLSAEGLTFSGVLDALRLDLARRYLADRTLTISQIAWLLGFQGVGAFSHAFRRWTGQSPRAARASVTTRPDATASLVF